jgi:hypothetical protein
MWPFFVMAYISLPLVLTMVVLTLLTDYGLRDSYVAEVKGVILGINPEVKIIDISHDVGNYDITSGAFNMARIVPYFPEGTVHVGVVDPTVGSERKAIILETEKAWLVGPDNGLLSPSAERLGVKGIYEINGHPEFPEKISGVFDGRDAFGPAGALLSRGVLPQEIGGEIGEYVQLTIFKPEIFGKTIHAEIIHVDGFGNCVTNITIETLRKIEIEKKDNFEVKFNEDTLYLPTSLVLVLYPKESPSSL